MPAENPRAAGQGTWDLRVDRRALYHALLDPRMLSHALAAEDFVPVFAPLEARVGGRIVAERAGTPGGQRLEGRITVLQPFARIEAEFAGAQGDERSPPERLLVLFSHVPGGTRLDVTLPSAWLLVAERAVGRLASLLQST